MKKKGFFKKIIKKRSSTQNVLGFDSLPRICFVILGDYSKGISDNEINSVKKSIYSCLAYKEFVRAYAKQCYPKENGEIELAYQWRIEKVTQEKVKIYIVCLAPSVDEKFKSKIKDFEEMYSLSSVDFYDPKDPDLQIPDIEHAFEISKYKFSGEIFIRINSGAQIPNEKTDKLFENPALNNLRSEPRFKELLKRMGSGN